MLSNNKKITKEMSLEELWCFFRGGNMLSFRFIYELHYDILYNFGLKFLSSEEVEDCIQNMFLYILQHKKSLKNVKNVKGYLITSLRNQIYTFQKVKKYNTQIVESTLIQEQSVYNKEFIALEIQNLLKKLTPRENEIVHLKYFQNYKNIEISELLNIKYQTVRNILHHALSKLKDSPFPNYLYNFKN